MPHEPINILLVDDHAIVIDGIAALLSNNPSYHIVGKAGDGQKALDIMAGAKTDVVITDYSMSGMDGFTLIRNIKKAHPGVKIIMLSMHDEPSIVRDVLRTGIDSYILKKYTHLELMTAIEVVTGGGQFWSPEVNKILLGKMQPDTQGHITEREMEVLKLLVSGMTNKKIAGSLFISERTVETHRKNLLRKTNCTNIVGLVKYVQAHGLM